ncbi:MAG TPA: HEPN domain-containing protein [Bacteroidia bacterium]|jgi:sulfite reductase (ferredoxin)|nr:HEPN domain-containing protein [Bacteroidia bacterium]HRG53301.1 HEPN domain-containing protein [Bacteroidia bacterium]
MKSFQTEIEDPLVQKDIIDLEKKIRAFRDGTLNEEKFRSLRLARGVYGQRQQGVQMIRIKLPFGKITTKQLLRIAAISDEYSTGNLHLTTRQDIQIHYVSLERTPELWAKLEQDDITLREACGNTVRNITASAVAGIDPKEPFDVSPYAHEMFKYLLRKPFGQELGRKFKIAYSSNEDDTAYTFMHDLGFIPKIKIVDGKEVRGFKVMIAGGLGAQPILAKVAHEFLEEDQIIPFTEAVIRVFDRHGERTSRHKARIKYLVAKIGIEQMMAYVAEERLATNVKSYVINREVVPVKLNEKKTFTTFKVSNEKKYQDWLKSNVFEQKQKGYYGVNVKILLGNFSSDTARLFAAIVDNYAADDIRITVNQGLLLKYVPKEALPALFQELDKLGFAEPGFDSVADITACPGTDTCNLGISSSTGIARELEQVVKEEYPDLLFNNDIKIKISGCMNSCGQHSLAQIGFHGSSFKNGAAVVPALQLVLGGGIVGDGEGRVSEKIIKIPSKRGPAVLRTLLDDFEKNSVEGEYFNSYYDKKGKDYFYQLLKPHADNSTLTPEEYIDWGHSEQFKTEIGVGECAGVMIDLVATLLYEVEEKIDWAESSYTAELYSDSIYHSYSAMVNAAKALLLGKSVPTNTQHGIINDFDKHFVETNEIKVDGTFKDAVLKINKEEPSKAFAEKFLTESKAFLAQAKAYREAQVKG